MPGVPSGRGCEGCRKQKKKCDQLKPSCSRCTRLGLVCIGAGQQRFKFMTQQTASPTANEKSRIALNPTRTPFTIRETIFPVPSNETSLLLSAFITAVRPATDLRYNLAWSYGGYLTQIPLRLGSNEALDAAAAALVEAHSDYCVGRRATYSSLLKHQSALSTLRHCLDDPVTAQSSETLCAVSLLQINQSFLGLSQGTWSGHGEGMARMLIIRGGCKARSEFEQMLLASMRGSVIFEALANSKIKLPAEEWKRLAHNPLDGDSHEGKLMRSLCMVPYFIEGRANPHTDPHEDAEVLRDIQAGYRSITPVIIELKLHFDEILQRDRPEIIIKDDAYLTRTYGLCLIIAIILNTVLRGVDSSNQSLCSEAAAFADDILVIATIARKYRPLGATYVPICLMAAWIAIEDPVMRIIIEDSLGEYQQHPSFGDMPHITLFDLDWTSKRFRLLNPPVPGIHNLHKIQAT